MMKNILILGATSEIAVEFIQLLPNDVNLFLAGRDFKALADLGRDCSAKNMKAELIEIDFQKPDFSPGQKFSTIQSKIDTIVLFAGSMGGENQLSIQNLLDVHFINFLNPIQSILYFLPELQKKENARILVVSSVAGERGRKKNFVYGSAKGALTLFASGLRGQLVGSGVHMTTVLLGLVDTKMTAGMKSPLIASKKNVAKKILQALLCNRDVVFVPFFWKPIMCVIRMIPERFFKKMSF